MTSLNTELDRLGTSNFIALVHESLQVRTQLEFSLWMQGRLQQLLPHDLMIAAWGDFALGLIHVDILSGPGQIDPAELHNAQLTMWLRQIFQDWQQQGSKPLSLDISNGALQQLAGGAVDGALSGIRSALAHGIQDRRGRHDCLYLLLSAAETQPAHASTMLTVVLPYIDCSLRQLEASGGATDALAPPRSTQNLTEDFGAELSARELEIMDWVRQGKTNFEIGMILDISAFTVKNHLQRIFRKLDVLNRAQAVAKLANLNASNELH